MSKEVPADSRSDDVLKANEQFYRALESQDLERMTDVWFHADWITCVHPGWAMLTGWKTVRESWERIFKSSEDIRIEVSNIGLRMENAIAWVTCRENILQLSSSGVTTVAAVATNIFARTPQGWKMVLHHVSAVPETSE